MFPPGLKFHDSFASADSSVSVELFLSVLLQLFSGNFVKCSQLCASLK